MKPIQLRSSLSLSWENTNCNAWYLTEAAKAARNRREISPLDSDATHGDHIEIQMNQPVRDSIVIFVKWVFFRIAKKALSGAQKITRRKVGNVNFAAFLFFALQFQFDALIKQNSIEISADRESSKSETSKTKYY